jgi:hypothetical protein
MASILKLLRVRFAEPPSLRSDQRPLEHVRVSNPWHAVSVLAGQPCCSAARELSGKRYLSSETPPALPLKGCVLVTCTCRYRHHDDRRTKAPGSAHPARDSSPRRRVDDAPSH